MSQALDLPRLHRFLVEHGTCSSDMGTYCVSCDAEWWAVVGIKAHAPDCEWVALVEMPKGDA